LDYRSLQDLSIQKKFSRYYLKAATPKFEAKRCGDSEHSSDCMEVSSGSDYASNFAGSA